MSVSGSKLGKGGVEARRTPRRVFQRVVGLLFHGEYRSVSALQISEGGMLIALEAQVPVHSKVVLSFLVPGAGSIVARAELIYERPQTNRTFHYGIKFENLPLQLRRMIRNYVSAKTQAEAEMEADDFSSAA